LDLDQPRHVPLTLSTAEVNPNGRSIVPRRVIENYVNNSVTAT
jgi:hypothetical protein